MAIAAVRRVTPPVGLWPMTTNLPCELQPKILNFSSFLGHSAVNSLVIFHPYGLECALFMVNAF
jgi:hypothetical protein